MCLNPKISRLTYHWNETYSVHVYSFRGTLKCVLNTSIIDIAVCKKIVDDICSKVKHTCWTLKGMKPNCKYFSVLFFQRRNDKIFFLCVWPTKHSWRLLSLSSFNFKSELNGHLSCRVVRESKKIKQKLNRKKMPRVGSVKFFIFSDNDDNHQSRYTVIFFLRIWKDFTSKKMSKQVRGAKNQSLKLSYSFNVLLLIKMSQMTFLALNTFQGHWKTLSWS